MAKIVITPSRLNQLSRQLDNTAKTYQRHHHQLARNTQRVRLNADDPNIRSANIAHRAHSHTQTLTNLSRRTNQHALVIERTAGQGHDADHGSWQPNLRPRTLARPRRPTPSPPVIRPPHTPRPFPNPFPQPRNPLPPIPQPLWTPPWWGPALRIASEIRRFNPVRTIGILGRHAINETRGLLGRAVDWTKKAATNLAKTGTNLVNKVSNGITTIGQALKNAFNWGKNKLKQLAKKLWNKIRDHLQVIFTEFLISFRDNLDIIKTVLASPAPGVVVGTVLLGPAGGVLGGYLHQRYVGPRIREWANRQATPWLVTKLYATLDPLVEDTEPTGDLEVRDVRGGLEGWPVRESDAEGRWPEPFTVDGGGSEQRGRNAIARGLEDTGNYRDGEKSTQQIFDDEFQIIDHGNNTYTIVLPGVTDLTNPKPGLNPHNRSVRDTDYTATLSASSTSVDDNEYAKMVKDYIKLRVGAGASISLVGHSFGADTALDLASDPDLKNIYHVTHVVAAAYHSEPQLNHISDDVNVLVLSNRYDIPVIVEDIGRAPSLSEMYPADRENLIHKTFRALSGGGHDQMNYIKYIESTDDPEVKEFFRDWEDAGYANDGKATAVDASVPPKG